MVRWWSGWALSLLASSHLEDAAEQGQLEKLGPFPYLVADFKVVLNHFLAMCNDLACRSRADVVSRILQIQANLDHELSE